MVTNYHNNFCTQLPWHHLLQHATCCSYSSYQYIPFNCTITDYSCVCLIISILVGCISYQITLLLTCNAGWWLRHDKQFLWSEFYMNDKQLTIWARTILLCALGLYVSLLYYFCTINGWRKYGTLHEFACHPCAGAMLIFSVSFQF